MEISPDAHWGPGAHSLAIGGPLQMAGAALLLSGRKTRWALGILVCYVALGSVFGNLPQVLNPHVGASAIAGLLSNLAVIGGLLYWLHGERAGQPLAYARDPKPQSLHDDRRGTAGNIA